MLVTTVLLSTELNFKLPGTVITIHYISIWLWANLNVCVYKLLMTTDTPHLMQQTRSRKSVASQD
jgi:hypothetical protein